MRSAVSRLGLDVSTFGAAAGAAGMNAAEAFATVALAADAGVRLVDCPPDPEAAERVLGEVLPREPAFHVVAHTSASERGAGAVLRRLHSSLHRLGLDRIGTVLAHPAGLLAADGPKLWDGLLRLKDQGTVGAVGVAACVCDDPAGLARRFRPDLMQLPLSLLDQRLLASGVLDEIAGRGVELHLRTRFLHGLQVFDGERAKPPSPVSSQVSRARRVLAEAGADPMQAALAFALSRPQASHVVVGVGSPAELRAVVGAAASPGPQLDWDALRSDAACSLDRTRCQAA